MGDINWKAIIAEVLRLIAEGLDKHDAIKKVASKFGVSTNQIMKRI